MVWVVLRDKLRHHVKMYPAQNQRPNSASVAELVCKLPVQVMGTSGLWEVMTAQEAVDFVHQCRHCRPDNLSCSQALTLEAHTRWKLMFSKVTNSSICCPLACLA